MPGPWTILPRMVRAAVTSLCYVGAAVCAVSTAGIGAAQSAAMSKPEPTQNTVQVPAFRNRPPQDEVMYFVLPDRFENGDPSNDQGGLTGGALDHGFDPTHKGFYHGGDLKGLTQRLDYIEALGATAIWLGPIYKNKPVQGSGEHASAGYHGYWITDFTTVDPHFGTEADLKTFVDAAHARGMKIYLDIITNHTADVIQYRECHDPAVASAVSPTCNCAYRSKGAYPYSTRGGSDGTRINEGFLGDTASQQSAANFAHLSEPAYAYTPYIPKDEVGVKVPAWLNDPIYYHNRGDSFWAGESARYGDFCGLDDLFTEHPRVLEGMIDIFKSWISRFGVDGFRVDTAKHVNPEFWQRFNAAMIDHAKSIGIPNFYIFGEVYNPDPGGLARFTRVDGFPAVLDFAFQSAVTKVVAQGQETNLLEVLFNSDALYAGGDKTAQRLPVFTGNHDMGRFGMFVRDANPDASEQEVYDRVNLANAMMFFLRGVPVIYYGDEQGFNGDGNDQASREDMFQSQVASYNDNRLIGSAASTADENFDTRHPLFRSTADMAALYKAHPALRSGRQVPRLSQRGGLGFAVSRFDQAGREYVIAFNAGDTPLTLALEVQNSSTHWSALMGACPAASPAPGSLSLDVPAFGTVICVAQEQ